VPNQAIDQATVVIVGAGIAGLSAAVAAAERLRQTGNPGQVLLVDRAAEHEAGGNTRWTSAYFRLDDLYDPGPSFVDDLMSFSAGRTPEPYVRRLVELLPETMEWIQDMGVRFRTMPTYFINSVRRRLQPVGGGEALLAALTRAALQHGVTIRYGTTAHGLRTDESGAITAVDLNDGEQQLTVQTRSVVIASGGFEGDNGWLDSEIGPGGAQLRTIAPGGAFNRGEGIAMALAAGAARAGQWDSFHAEPVDPRSGDAEALVMVFPYGILVNRDGLRFTDEGRGTIDETYEGLARAVWRQPGGIAYFITDQQHLSVEAWKRGLLTSVRPIEASTLDDLATATGIPAGTLRRTVEEFNASAPAGTFDWHQPDGLATAGLEPPKSNWAVPLTTMPFVCYPVSCAIVFTFGGLMTDTGAQVLRADGTAMPGLYAAGECTGIYYGKYPGGTSVMRGMVFGRVAGAEAVTHARERLRSA
jgi:tricarballylate dehydrogenase